MSRRNALQPPVPPLSPLPPPTTLLSGRWRGLLALVVCAYLGFGLAYLLLTPVLPAGAGSLINAPDEAAHLGYVRLLRRERRLPVAEDRGATYEWHQPPLYYALAAILPDADGRGARAVSLVCGLLSTLLIFRAARRLFPDDPALAVLAAGVAGLLPMRQTITAAAGNDALTELLFSLFLLQLVEAFRNGYTLQRAGAVGLPLAAALLTKATGLLLLPVLLLALVFFWREGDTAADVLRGSVWTLLLAAAFAGPWFARNIALYHEFTPVRAFMHEFEGTSKASDWIGRRPLAADPWTGALAPAPIMTRAGYLTLVGNWSFRTFWAAWTPKPMAAIGAPVFLPPPVYLLYGLLCVAALIGMTRLHFRRKTDFTPAQLRMITLFFATLLLVAGSFAGFIWTFFQAQGRYLYPAMLPLALIFALGYRACLPARYRDAGSVALLGLLFVLSLAFLAVGILPAYT